MWSAGGGRQVARCIVIPCNDFPPWLTASFGCTVRPVGRTLHLMVRYPLFFRVMSNCEAQNRNCCTAGISFVMSRYVAASNLFFAAASCVSGFPHLLGS